MGTPAGPQLSYEDIALMIEHSVLRPELSEEDVRTGCEIAREYRVASVSVRPSDVDLAVRWMEGSGVLVASTLGPADVAELAINAEGMALAGGGVTAHAAIVARSLGVPMVVGLGPEVLEVEDGEEVVLDGDAGVIFRHPERGRIDARHAPRA